MSDKQILIDSLRGELREEKEYARALEESKADAERLLSKKITELGAAEKKLAALAPDHPASQGEPQGRLSRHVEAASEQVRSWPGYPDPASQGEEREPDLSEIRCTVCDRQAAYAKEAGSICAFARPGRLTVCRGVLLAPDATQKRGLNDG